jgi:hypothetical protein
MDDAPEKRLHCAVNGANNSAILDTRSVLMLASRDFARRKHFTVRRGREYIWRVELIHGSSIYTYGMVLDAEFQFDVPLTSSRGLDCDQCIHFQLVFPHSTTTERNSHHR